MTRLSDERGFTLIELMVAALVLVIGIGATITVLISSTHASSSAERNDSGVALAEREMEKIRALPYNSVAVNSATSYPVTGGSTDPAGRISGANFAPYSGLSEGLVTASTGARRYDDTTTDPTLTTIGSGSGAITARIYRFVSWHDMQCPSASNVLNLTQLANLQNLLSTGLSNSITATITGDNTLLGNITTVSTLNFGILNVALHPLLVTLNGLLNPLVAPLNALNTRLNTFRNSVNALLNSFTGLNLALNIDLCDVDLTGLAKQLDALLTAFSSLQTSLQSTTTTLGTALTNEQGAVNALNTQLVALINAPLNLTNLTNLLNSLINGVLINNVSTTINGVNTVLTPLEGQVTSIQSQIAGIQSTVSSLNNSAATTHNSKRVTIAVWLDPAGKEGPLNPIWLSTIVTDPASGIAWN